MEPSFDDAGLDAEFNRLQRLVAVCERHGEADGANAARAQLRAIAKERQERRDAASA